MLWSRPRKLGHLERTQTMKGKRSTPEENIWMLQQVDKGETILEVCRENNISEQTFHRWKGKYADTGISELRRLKQFDEENSRLKKLVADILYFLTA